jgi:hypothetical protein
VRFAAKSWLRRWNAKSGIDRFFALGRAGRESRKRQYRITAKIAMNAKEPSSLQNLDEALRREAEQLLREAEIWDFDAFGWLDADTADPEFFGHALWQTDSLSDVYLEYGFSDEAREPPEPTEWQKLVAVSGADFCGLMKTARMTFGLLLFQAKLLRANIFHDDTVFDQHWMSTVIYLSTASDRLRELFIAAVFRRSSVEYKNDKNGHYYKGEERRWYSTPFKEANADMPRRDDLSVPFDKLLPMAAEIYKFQKTRNAIIHEVATLIGHRERQLLDNQSWKVRPEKNFDFSDIDIEKTKQDHEDAHEKRISETISQLTEWYFLLVRASNEVFIIENTLRREALKAHSLAAACARPATARRNKQTVWKLKKCRKMTRRNRTFARQRACDGREAPKIAHHFPTAARSFEFPHSL